MKSFHSFGGALDQFLNELLCYWGMTFSLHRYLFPFFRISAVSLQQGVLACGSKHQWNYTWLGIFLGNRKYLLISPCLSEADSQTFLVVDSMHLSPRSSDDNPCSFKTITSLPFPSYLYDLGLSINPCMAYASDKLSSSGVWDFIFVSIELIIAN